MRQELADILETVEPTYLLDDLGVDYKQTYGSSGRQLNVKDCPSCGDNRWKVYLNEESGLGNCFRCDTKFNKFSFAREELGISNRETFEYLQRLAEEIGWRPKRQDTQIDTGEPTKLVIPESVELPISGCNLQYLEDRGIDIETATHFGLRYCFSGSFAYQWNGEEAKQRYDSRVIVPIYDMDGTLVSFQGRDITGKASKKYLFPPGFASTGRYLFNGHRAKSAASIVVGEGVFDVMSLHVAMRSDAGTAQVVPIGTFGKHMSASDDDARDQLGQFLVLRRHGLREVTFMWDSEKKAIDAAVESGEKLRSLGFTVRIAVLPKGKDPNECSSAEVVDAFKRATTLNKLTAIKLRVSQ